VNARLLCSVACIAVAATAGTARAADPGDPHDFSRYQVILERSPFGPLAGTGVEPPPPGFATRFAFVGLASENPDAPLQAVVFDKEKNRTHFVAEADAFEGVTVVRIEKSPPKLTLKHGLELATLNLEDRPAVGAPPPGFAPGQPAPPATTPGVRRIPFRRGS
jgi:hypothetical protein